MFSSKYRSYLGVATGCVGLGLALKYTTTNDNLKLSLRNSVNSVAEDVLYTPRVKYDFSFAIEESRRAVMKDKELSGTPGVSIAVNIDGITVWTEGMGYADVENEVQCTPLSVMRIASISKSITMAVLARLWQEGSIDLDKPIQEYLPEYPVHSFDGEKVNITTRMLVSHLSGIRHYTKKENDEKNNIETKEINGETKKDEKASKEEEKQRRDTEFKEMFMTKRFKSVEEALNIFKDDELFHKPGSGFLYTTYGWTVVSAVIEAATKSTFPKIMSEFFSQMGLKDTYLDYNEPIVFHRARYYSRPKTGRLKNAHPVDNSYKWAGGGFMSTVGDLCRFGDVMMYCFQQGDEDQPGYLKADTVEELWSVKVLTPCSTRGSGYGMGWEVVPSRHEFGWGDKQNMVVYHTGAAVGASSVLLMLPRNAKGESPPSGITVAILGNLDNVNWSKTAMLIAESFQKTLSQ